MSAAEASEIQPPMKGKVRAVLDRLLPAQPKATASASPTSDRKVSAREPDTTRVEPRHGRAEPLSFPEIKPWPNPVSGVDVLDELVATFRSYLALQDGAAEAMALWVMFTHAFDVAEASPRLALTSPVPQCGKSRVLSILTLLVPRPAPASNWTPAVVFRVIERDLPTLLIDEADTFLDQRSDLRGILNSGHTRPTAFVMRADGDNYEPRSFSHGLQLRLRKSAGYR